MLFELLHNSATIFMTGIIWLCQLLIYPSFNRIEPSRWQKFHQTHRRTMALIVTPPMLIQLVGSAMLFWHSRELKDLIFFSIASALLIVTLTIFVPLHNKLSLAPMPKELDQLFRLNWIRTMLWSLASVIIIFVPIVSIDSTWLPEPEIDASKEEALEKKLNEKFEKTPGEF